MPGGNSTALISTLIAIVAVTVSTGLALVIARAIVAGVWRRFAEAFPAKVEPAAGAVWRRRQGISIGVCNFGFCFDIGVDEGRLHLSPNAFGRAMGLRGVVSVPWDRVRVLSERVACGPVPGVPCLRAEIAGRHVVAPAWCLELAEPPPTSSSVNADPLIDVDI